MTKFHSLLLLVALTLGGCSILEKPLTPKTSEATTAPPLVAQNTPTPKPTPPPIKAAIKPLNVAVLISRDIENHHIIFHKIERLILDKKGTVKPFYLYQQSDTAILEQIESGSHQQVVAIGLTAAKAAARLPRVPVIFCQVYNFQDHNLINEYIKGVSLIPSVEQQLLAWKNVLPKLKQVGFITGNDKHSFIDSATKIAATHQITLINRTVNNDKEMWAEFRRLTPQVDAFWLLPDNRILSKRTLHSIINYSTKHGVPLFTINGLLLQAGAVISSTQMSDDIAEKVVSRLLSIKPDNTIPGIDIEPLTHAHTFINTQAIDRLDLTINNDTTTINLERWPSPGVNATLAQ